MFDFGLTGFDGLRLVRPTVRPDSRGSFVKLLHGPSFEAAGLEWRFPEQYCSTSRQGVLRGMHFQTPPHDHAKLVYCLSGRVLDVALDLRRGSQTYGQAFSAELDGEITAGLYLPRGFAHGFLTLSEEATLAYFVETVHAPESDAGVRWDSFGFAWPTDNPPTSPRDAALPLFGDLEIKLRSGAIQ